MANVFIATMTSSCSCRNVINLEPAHGGKSICMLVKLTMPTEFNTFTAVCIHVLASKNLYYRVSVHACVTCPESLYFPLMHIISKCSTVSLIEDLHAYMERMHARKNC